MNTKQVFDKIVSGLASQGWQRSVDGSACRYRNSNGLKCAAGWIIPDELYNRKIEGMSFLAAISSNHLDFRWLGLGDHSNNSVVDLVCVCQHAHDMTNRPEDLVDRLIQIAKSFKLNLPEELESPCIPTNKCST